MMKSILLLLPLVTNAVVMAYSGYEICATTGQSNAAFHNGPGQCCGFTLVGVSHAAARCSRRAMSLLRSACVMLPIININSSQLRLPIIITRHHHTTLNITQYLQ